MVLKSNLGPTLPEILFFPALCFALICNKLVRIGFIAVKLLRWTNRKSDEFEQREKYEKYLKGKYLAKLEAIEKIISHFYLSGRSQKLEFLNHVGSYEVFE